MTRPRRQTAPCRSPPELASSNLTKPCHQILDPVAFICPPAPQIPATRRAANTPQATSLAHFPLAYSQAYWVDIPMQERI